MSSQCMCVEQLETARRKCFACYAAILKGLYKCIVRNTGRNQQINAHVVKNVVEGQWEERVWEGFRKVVQFGGRHWKSSVTAAF